MTRETEFTTAYFVILKVVKEWKQVFVKKKKDFFFFAAAELCRQKLGI